MPCIALSFDEATMMWYLLCLTSFLSAVIRHPRRGVVVPMLIGDTMRSVLRSTTFIPVAFFLAVVFFLVVAFWLADIILLADAISLAVASLPMTKRAKATVIIVLFISSVVSEQ